MVNIKLIITLGVAVIIGGASPSAFAQESSDQLTKLKALNAEELDSERGAMSLPDINKLDEDTDSSEEDSAEPISESLIAVGTGTKEEKAEAIGAFVTYKTGGMGSQLSGVGGTLGGIGSPTGVGGSGTGLTGGQGVIGLPITTPSN